ncbi:tol-pal system protein [Gammaproteobacteria bacterium]|nr:tol-pal system protein [Gammaproteobacteria bacterium]
MKEFSFTSLLFLTVIFSTSSANADDNETLQADILFLKIQELEVEIADLRNKVESQSHLIKKLIAESVTDEEAGQPNELLISGDLRFKGMEDIKSKEDVFQGAVSALEGQDLDTAFNLFTYFIENFNDNEKNAISYFWLGEISIIKNNLDASNDYFMELILSYPSHYRVPLAHKKIGDIYMKKNEPIRAKEKYNFVVREYPKDTASSLALQLLKNME